MQCIQISQKSHALNWKDDQASIPTPGPDEVRVKVYAAGINRADLTQRDGLYPPPEGASRTLGLECSGVIDAVGSRATGYQVGDAVCALLAGGGYAEYVCVPVVQVLPVPRGLSFIQAAAIPEVYATVWQNIFMDAELRSGQSVLVHAGGSGVGTAAIQLCHAFGAQVFATLRDESKTHTCLALGAKQCFLVHQGTFKEAILDWTEHKGIDVILDPVGADYLADNLSVLKEEGRLCLIAALSGMRADIDLRPVLMKRLKIQGSMLRPKTPHYKQQVLMALLINVWPLFESGAISPVIDEVYPIDQATDAFDYLASNKALGKLVLEIRQE